MKSMEYGVKTMENNEIIYAYSRKQAIEDGVLIDCSEMAKEAGIKYPVAITSTVWNQYIVPDFNLIAMGQSIEGRLWDVLWMFRVHALKSESSIMFFDVYFIMKDNKQVLIRLKSICGPGDDAEPVITIMLPDED